MAEKIKVWHSGEWTCLLADDGNVKATVSLTKQEAAKLRDDLTDPEFDRAGRVHGDAGESERLYGLKAGHVLSEQDAKDLDNLLADHNEELGASGFSFEDGRLSALREIGGDELVAADEAARNAMADRLMARAMNQLKCQRLKQEIKKAREELAGVEASIEASQPKH